MGGLQSLAALGARTASGIRSQHHEIKYKKPTAASLGNCGAGVSKMIHCDSFEKNFGGKGRWPGNGGDNATRLNRSESLHAFVRRALRATTSSTRPRQRATPTRGVGGYKSLGPLGARYRV